MKEKKIFTFPITPQTNVRTNQGDRIWFRIPENEITSEDGLRRKRRIERYNEYKADISAYAKQKRFQLPEYGIAIYFYIPIPIRWPKKKREAMHFALHEQAKPDIDNFLKAFFDSLRKDDHRVAQLSGLGKFWVDVSNMERDEKTKRLYRVQGTGWIEVHLNQPVFDPRKAKGLDPAYTEPQTPKTAEIKKMKKKANSASKALSQALIYFQS